jgi:hypothetical protein
MIRSLGCQSKMVPIAHGLTVAQCGSIGSRRSTLMVNDEWNTRCGCSSAARGTKIVAPVSGPLSQEINSSAGRSALRRSPHRSDETNHTEPAAARHHGRGGRDLGQARSAKLPGTEQPVQKPSTDHQRISLMDFVLRLATYRFAFSRLIRSA